MGYDIVLLTDPPGISPLSTGLMWIQNAMLGSIATSIAVLAVAALGALMLAGRLPARRAALVVIGCFVVFGARGIATAITGGVDSGGQVAKPPAQLTPPLAPPVPAASSYDPYAGAAVPVQ